MAVNRIYTPNGLNQYGAVTGISTISYDPKGNLTQGGGATYSYNAENELATQGSYRFYYDPHHRMLYSTQTGTRLLYDGTNLAAEYNSTGTVQRRYVFGPNSDEPLVWYEGSGTSSKRWLAADAQGSIVQVTDGTGATLATNTYDEYGIPASSNNTYAGRFRYTGQQWISELGMYYYKARIYSPTFGRFLQTDPVGYKDQVNLYTYVGNDPVNRTDPSGEVSDLGFGLLGGCPAGSVCTSTNPAASNQAAGAEAISLVAGGTGVAASGVQFTSGKTTVATNRIGFYPKGFRGNQYVKTMRLSELADLGGRAAVGVGIAADTSQLLTGEMTKTKFGVNRVVDFIGLRGGLYGAVFAGAYFGVDHFYKGGVEGAVSDFANARMDAMKRCQCDPDRDAFAGGQ